MYCFVQFPEIIDEQKPQEEEQESLVAAVEEEEEEHQQQYDHVQLVTSQKKVSQSRSCSR